MSLVLPKDQGADFELCPSGTFIATCYRVIDLGTQQIDWKGTIKHQKKINLSWELTEEKMDDGRPFTINKRYTLSSSDKANLRIDLESWRGVPFKDEDFGNFDIGNLLGKSCLLGIIHNHKDGKTFCNISSILRVPKSMPVPELVNPIVRFDLSNFDKTVYEAFSNNLKATIAKSPEYADLMGLNKHTENTAEEMPPFAPTNAQLSDIPF